jgi:hypothetical protein
MHADPNMQKSQFIDTQLEKASLFQIKERQLAQSLGHTTLQTNGSIESR